MITSIDTNVLLDLLIPHARFADTSVRALDSALAEGGLVIGEVVYAELACHFGDRTALDSFLADTRIRLDESRPPSLVRAALAWRRYTERTDKRLQCPYCGQRQALECSGCGEPITVRQRILSDLPVGGHALEQGDRLLKRDRGYFPDLEIVAP